MTKGFRFLTIFSWLIFFAVGVFIGLLLPSLEAPVVEVPVIINPREQTDDQISVVIDDNEDVWVIKDLAIADDQTISEILENLIENNQDVTDFRLLDSQTWRYWLNDNQLDLSLDQIILKAGDIIFINKEVRPF